jgi:hypothetical protein
MRKKKKASGAKRPRNRKTIDGTACSDRRLRVARERKYTNIEGETGHGCLVFDEARRGDIIRKDELIGHKYSTRESELEEKKRKTNSNKILLATGRAVS